MLGHTGIPSKITKLRIHFTAFHPKCTSFSISRYPRSQQVLVIIPRKVAASGCSTAPYMVSRSKSPHYALYVAARILLSYRIWACGGITLSLSGQFSVCLSNELLLSFWQGGDDYVLMSKVSAEVLAQERRTPIKSISSSPAFPFLQSDILYYT